jgi:hypothetical protein
MVWAEKIINIEMDPKGSGAACLFPGYIYVSKEYMEKHNPEIGGYYVKYVDGYESFSPSEAFEEGYSPSAWNRVTPIHDPLFSNIYTIVAGGNITEDNATALHDFIVIPNDDVDDIGHDLSNTKVLAEIHFQQGPIKECGVNGVMNEDLLLMVITRLRAFQRGQFACRENAVALTKLEEAVMWLRKRTQDRTSRGVEGTHQI